MNLSEELADLEGQCVKMQQRIIQITLPHMSHNHTAKSFMEEAVYRLDDTESNIRRAAKALGMGISA